MNSMIKCVQSSDSQIQQATIPQIRPGAVIPAESLLALSKRFISKGGLSGCFCCRASKAYPITLDLCRIILSV